MNRIDFNNPNNYKSCVNCGQAPLYGGYDIETMDNVLVNKDGLCEACVDNTCQVFPQSQIWSMRGACGKPAKGDMIDTHSWGASSAIKSDQPQDLVHMCGVHMNVIITAIEKDIASAIRYNEQQARHDRETAARKLADLKINAIKGEFPRVAGSLTTKYNQWDTVSLKVDELTALIESARVAGTTTIIDQTTTTIHQQLQRG